MSDARENLPPITLSMEAITTETVQAFAEATLSEHFKTIPPSFATRFRKAEFEWLTRMQVDMRTLLHIEQEYEFVSPLVVGDPVEVSTKIAQWKERKSMTFVTLETTISAQGKVKIKSITTFLLQTGGVK